MQTPSSTKFHHRLSKDLWYERFSFKRTALYIFFVMTVASLFHFRQARVPRLEEGTCAKRFITAQVDFEYPNHLKRKNLQHEASLDIDKVYRIDPRMIREKTRDILQSNWRDVLEIDYETMKHAVRTLAPKLEKLRFSEPRTLKKVQCFDPCSADFYLTHFSSTGHTIEEQGFWRQLASELSEKTHPSVADYLVKEMSKVQWNMEQDLSKEGQLRQKVREEVPMQYSRVEAGSILVSPKETISPHHIVMMTAMKKAMNENKDYTKPLNILGNLLLGFIFSFFIYIYLKSRHLVLFNDTRKLLLLISILFFSIAIAKGCEYSFIYGSYNLQECVAYPLYVPLATLLVTILIGPELAFFVAGFLSILFGLTLAVQPAQFMTINMASAYIGIQAASMLRNRREIYRISLRMVGSSAVVIFAFNLSSPNISWDNSIRYDLFYSLLFSYLISTVVIIVLPFFEKVFNAITDISLKEYENTPLIDELNENPAFAGTFEHSKQVGDLAEQAATSIGARRQLCKVAALYHDIGKRENPNSFIENQQGNGNIHDALQAEDSAGLIIGHVTLGVKIAKEYKLPQPIRDIIAEHHGTTLLEKFYQKRVEEVGDVSKVDEAAFRYPGPKPQTVESAIVMMADTVEAASRPYVFSRSPDELNWKDFVNSMIQKKIDDGQFDECPITFQQIQAIKRSFVQSLRIKGNNRGPYYWASQNRATDQS